MLDWNNRDINIDGERLNQLCLADDVFMSEMFEKCLLQQTTEKIDLKINYNKIKMMINLVSSEKVVIEDNAIEIVEEYIYLGHEMKIRREIQTAELLRRRNMVRNVWENTRYIQNQSPNEAKKAFNQCMLPILTYGAETLTLTKTSTIIDGIKNP